MTAEALLSSNSFSVISNKKSCKAQVTLTKNSLAYTVDLKSSCCVRRQAGLCVIDLCDVYGAKVFQSCDDNAVYFRVYSCPLRKRRQAVRTCFKITDPASPEESVAIAERWIRTILWLSRESDRDLSEIEGKVYFQEANVCVLLRKVVSSRVVLHGRKIIFCLF